MNCSNGSKVVVWTVLMLTFFAAGAVQAEDPAETARAIGQAGRAAAGAIAKDAGFAADVPGYAGTNVPERSLSAAGLEAAAARALADPDDPGGRAGRAVIEAAAGRSEAPVGADDPIALRADRIEGDAQSSRWKADGLASGHAADCDAGVEDAQAGGACGA